MELSMQGLTHPLIVTQQVREERHPPSPGKKRDIASPPYYPPFDFVVVVRQEFLPAAWSWRGLSVHQIIS